MIFRLWRGRVETATANAYCRHFTETVVPALKILAGHRGAWLLRRDADGDTEFLAITLWESRQSIEAFAGANIDVAIVEPEGCAVLSDFDDSARHYEVAFRS